MAITMSGAKVETDERDSLLSSSIDQTITDGGAAPNTSGGAFGFGATESGASLAGVTESFAQNVTAKIETYITDVNTAVDELSTVEVNQAFKGAGLEAALNNFVESVKGVAKNYTDKLKRAEDQIINSVAAAYATQDSDLSENLGSDASSLESSLPK